MVSLSLALALVLVLVHSSHYYYMYVMNLQLTPYSHISGTVIVVLSDVTFTYHSTDCIVCVSKWLFLTVGLTGTDRPIVFSITKVLVTFVCVTVL